MKTFVIDTSAMVRLYVPDGPVPDGLERAVEAAWRAEAALLAPELALAELAQALHKKERAGYLYASEADEMLRAILELPITFARHRDLLPSAVVLARQHELTIYDALFLALAVRKKGQLVTADNQLAEAFQALP